MLTSSNIILKKYNILVVKLKYLFTQKNVFSISQRYQTIFYYIEYSKNKTFKNHSNVLVHMIKKKERRYWRDTVWHILKNTRAQITYLSILVNVVNNYKNATILMHSL